MARLTLLLTLVALALPGAALASPPADRDAAASALATERYYSSYGNPAPTRRPRAPTVPTGHAGPSWLGAAAHRRRPGPARRRPRRLRRPHAAPARPRRLAASRPVSGYRGRGPRSRRRGVRGGCASARARPRTPKATSTSAIRPSPMPGIVEPPGEVADERRLGADRGVDADAGRAVGVHHHDGPLALADLPVERAAVGRGGGPERLGGGHRGAGLAGARGACRA